MEKKTYKPIASYTADMLGKVREQIIDGIVGVLNFLGGKVCVAYYTDEAEAVNRMTFYETNIDGYGTELFVRDIELTEDGLKACLEDSESACRNGIEYEAHDTERRTVDDPANDLRKCFRKIIEELLGS